MQWSYFVLVDDLIQVYLIDLNKRQKYADADKRQRVIEGHIYPDYYILYSIN